MKTPSTSDLTHAQANNAYDRLAVISDHMPMLHELCDFIFDLQDWLKANQHKFLQEFIDNMNSELEVVKARLESLALTHDMDKITLQNAINSINSSISNLTNLINQVDSKATGLLIHTLNPSDDTHGVTCKAIADYVSDKIATLTGNLGNLGTSLEGILSRLSSLETRVTDLENTVGGLGSGSSSTGRIIIPGFAGNPSSSDFTGGVLNNTYTTEQLHTGILNGQGMGGGDGSMSSGTNQSESASKYYAPATWKCVKAPTIHTEQGGNKILDSQGYFELIEYTFNLGDKLGDFVS